MSVFAPTRCIIFCFYKRDHSNLKRIQKHTQFGLSVKEIRVHQLRAVQKDSQWSAIINRSRKRQVEVILLQNTLELAGVIETLRHGVALNSELSFLLQPGALYTKIDSLTRLLGLDSPMETVEVLRSVMSLGLNLSPNGMHLVCSDKKVGQPNQLTAITLESQRAHPFAKGFSTVMHVLPFFQSEELSTEVLTFFWP